MYVLLDIDYGQSINYDLIDVQLHLSSYVSIS